MCRSIRFNCVIVCSVLSFLILLHNPSAGFTAKNYQITQVKIHAQLHSDGNMDVTETRTYRFEGNFSYAYRVLPTTESVTFQDFRVSESGQPYPLSESEEPGTYRIIQKQGEIEVRWFFRARDESRTFDFQYRSVDAIQRHEDAAALYFQFISRDFDRASQNVRLRLQPPQPLIKTQVNEWLHGPLWAESRIEGDGSITAWCEYLPKHTFFELRVLYPPGIFSRSEDIPGRVRPKIMAEEAEWTEEANRQRREAVLKEEARKQRWARGKWIVTVMSLAGFMGWWAIYNKFGKRPQLPPSIKIASDIPAETPPALVGYLLHNREIYGSALVGTLFDLARRRVIALREELKEKRSLFGGSRKKSIYFWDLNRDYWMENSAELSAYENELIRFIFDELAQGEDSIDINRIKKQQSKFTKFFKKWKKEVKKLGNQQGWFDKKSIRGMVYSFGLSGAFLTISILSTFQFGPWAAILGFAFFVILILSFLIPHRTREGEMQARHWKALKRYLQKYHYRTADQKTLLHRLNDYLIYGVVLGLHKKIFKDLAASIPPDNVNHYIPWFVFHSGRTTPFSPESFASSFSSMIATTTSAMSTAAGTGGGASAGGGGGASSGGGGAG